MTMVICRHAKVGLIPSEQAEDCDVSNYQIELPSNCSGAKRASKLKSMLENSHFAKLFLLFVTLLGTSMVIGDGILTPSISVLSAVGGIKEATSAITEDWIVWISVDVLVYLFTFEKLGTEKVGYTFASIICIWFVLIGGIGAVIKSFIMNNVEVNNLKLHTVLLLWIVYKSFYRSSVLANVCGGCTGSSYSKSSHDYMELLYNPAVPFVGVFSSGEGFTLDFRTAEKIGNAYDEQNKEKEHFKSMLIEKLKEFIIEDYKFHRKTLDPMKNIVELESEDLAEQQQHQAEQDVI
ncbi:hypothetical protein Dsin_013096 [Dipteronia sinensis]|uniref:K+ potassium transporter integral membrane domain-containing protein n=1 Tax=Dipteronia sinensis TaxID=43782 RepID=A0AAE0E8N3_9ROSI|nr:hypothetical protein Dsin_013096 [Dipteronia sinensis]